MNFQKPLTVLLLLLGGILLAGCTKTTATTPVAGDITSNQAVLALRDSQPKRRADIMGTVKSAVGNEFTIETLDLSGSELLNQDPQAMRTKMEAMSDTERQAFFQDMQKARESAKKINSDVTIPVGIPILVRLGGRGGGFGGPGGGGFARGGAGGQGGAGGAGLGAALSQRSTTRNGSGGAFSGKQGDIADIKVGNSISVWLMTGTTDRKIAERVSTSAGNGGARGGAGGGGFGGGGFGGGAGGGGGGNAGGGQRQ